MGVLLLSWACGTVDPVDPVAPGPFETTGHRDDPSTPSTTSSGVTLITVGATDDSTGSDGSEEGSSSTGLDGTTGGGTDPCPVGSEGCRCAAGSTCDFGLACLSMICVDPGPHCPVGSEGCPCTRSGTCDTGLQCLANENVCVER
jgi:hypothetical protein